MQAFGGSQDADEAYYKQGADARRELDPPFVDTTVYADWNALAAGALLRASLLLGQPQLAGPALAALETLWERGHGRHGMAHYLVATGPGRDNVRPGPVAGLLGDQALVTAAMLDAYEHTGERAYLARAELLADWVGKHLSAPRRWLPRPPPDDDAQGLLAQPVPDPSHAAVMADDLLRLAAYTGELPYRERAGRALASLGGLQEELRTDGRAVRRGAAPLRRAAPAHRRGRPARRRTHARAPAGGAERTCAAAHGADRSTRSPTSSGSCATATRPADRRSPTCVSAPRVCRPPAIRPSWAAWPPAPWKRATDGRAERAIRRPQTLLPSSRCEASPARCR